MKKVTRSALRYYGGKWNLAPWIIEHFPDHVCYVEPFAGAASVLLRKNPSRVEVYNDLDGEVVNFFRVLRTRPEELIAALELTPYSRAELRLTMEETPDELERARRLFVRCWMSRGGGRNDWQPCWRFTRNDAQRRALVDDWRDVWRLREVVERLRGVQIECDDALAVIKRFDSKETLFYCDPPYLAETRSERWGANGYFAEMDESGHRAFAEALASIEGMALVSGYDSELYREVFAGWDCATRNCYTEGRATKARPKRMECLWISPAAQERARQVRSDVLMGAV